MNQIFVDRIRSCVPTRQWRQDCSCHLYALPGGADDLHAFAADLGLKRRWFQSKGKTMPHYDLTRGMRYRAVQAGAVEVSDQQLVAHLDLWRERFSPPSVPFFYRLFSTL